jgi:hypothetical protein
MFAILSTGQIITTSAWQGDIIETFQLKNQGLWSNLYYPFNNGLEVLLVTSEAFF